MTDTALPVTTAPPVDPVRAALADPAVGERLLALARSMLRRPGVDHHDVVQIAVERALANAHKFNPELGSVTVWLTGFVRMIAREQLKSSSRRANVDDNLDRLPDAPANAPDLAEEWATVRKHLASLPEPLRRAVELRHLSELDYPAVAAALGTTEVTARQRVSRGIQMLRTLANKEAS